MKKLSFKLILIALFLATAATVNAQGTKIKTFPDGVNGLEQFPQLTQVDLETVPVFVRNPTEVEIAALEARKRYLEARENPMVYSIAVYSLDVNIGMEDGIWVESNGKRIWTIAISVPNAKDISADFDELYLAPNTEMYLFSPEGKEILGPYTDAHVSDRNLARQRIKDRFLARSKSIEEQEEFAAGLAAAPFISFGVQCKGTMIIQIIEPADSELTSTLKITGLSAEPLEEKTRKKALGDALDCHRDVVCYPEWEEQSNGVCRIYRNIVGNRSNASGALMNNTKKDKKPYILSALHVFDMDGDGSINNDELMALANNYLFYFFNKKKTCPDNSSDMEVDEGEVRVGAYLVASYLPADAVLLELVDSAPDDACFLGWNRSTAAPAQGIIIHHPKGDVMKFSRDKTALNTNGIALDSTHPAGYFWAAHWDEDEGAVEPGSSGAPWFDNNGYVVGVHYGAPKASADAPCSTTIPRGGYCGRFDRFWTGGGTADTRLSNWLDPLGLSPQTLEIYNTPTGEKPITAGSHFDCRIYPNPNDGEFTIDVTGNTEPYTVEFFSTSGTLLDRMEHCSVNQLNINRSSLPDGMYFVKLTMGTDTVTKKVIVK